MSLTVGTLLGPYEILAPIGEGGMGDVYKARDTRLNRIVALKTSKTEFSERFEREARAVAALNHSHISQLYDVGPNYLVMEYIEGAPLKGPLPLDQALKYGAQICDALDAAHKKGITHRDLKPANILVTKTGIKLLDFGIAKMTAPAVTGSEDATMRMALTGNNEMVGTLYYMSPEQLQAQANGREIDARSDIFSFGIVLYEMLTGKRPFAGSSPATVIAAIMERPAPSIAEIAPPALDRLLQRCLAKDPDERWQTARDLRAELQWIAKASPETATAPTEVTRRRLLPWAIAATLAFIAAASWWRPTRPAELKPLVRLELDLGPDGWRSSEKGANAILSPDGARLVYVSRGKLFIRKLDQSKSTELLGTEGAASPFFSPDGQWVGFFAMNKLKKLFVEGGSPIILCEAPFNRGGSWGEDGAIIAALSVTGLVRIPSTGGAPTPIAELAVGEVWHAWPQILPSGKAVLFSSLTAGGRNIEVLSLKDRKRKTLVRGGSFGRYLSTGNGVGHLVYVNNSTLLAVAFDPEAVNVRGTPVPVLEMVANNQQSDVAPLIDISQSGMLLYKSGTGTSGGLVNVQWLDSEGNTWPLLAKPGQYRYPRLSPAGQRLALDVMGESTRDVFVYEGQRDTMMRLTFDGGGVLPMSPVWSPDGRYVVFRGKGGLFWTRSDGGGKPQPLTQSKNAQFPYSFAPGGKRLAWQEVSGSTGLVMWTMPLENDATGLRAGTPEVLLQSSFNQRHPMFSPDGRWLAYCSDESGTYQIYVRAFPDRGGKWQISNAGGTFPIWSRNGRELFFRSDDDHIMVVNYQVKDDSLLAGQPRVWSEKRLADVGILGSYDVAPDGKRVVALMPVDTPEGEQSQNHVIFLLNFFDELRRKVPLSGK